MMAERAEAAWTGPNMLALIARNHDLLRVAAETRRRTLRMVAEKRRRTRQAREASARAKRAAEHAREVAERAMLIMARRAVLSAAAAGGWDATLEAVKAALQRNLRNAHCAGVELEEKTVQIEQTGRQMVLGVALPIRN